MRDIVTGQTLDQYRVEEVVARSGTATIFRASDPESGLAVALKVPHSQFDADPVFQYRFQQEEVIGLRLDHPAITRVLRPRSKSRAYIAMEYVDGQPLGERLRDQHRLQISIAVELAICIADALDYLHRQGVIHCDLKPDNVMVLRGGGIKLMDFGIAVESARARTWGGYSRSMGTPDYMSPERIEGRRGDERADLYSLGCILYEMLTGEVPFPAQSLYVAMRAKTEAMAPSPRSLRTEVPVELAELVLCLLERNPADRPESALEVREKLRHPGSVVFSVRSWPKQPRLHAGVQLLAGLFGMVLLFAGFWMLAAKLGR